MKKFGPAVIAVLFALLALLGTPVSSVAQDRTAVVITAAPIYLLPDAGRTPLRILEGRSTVVVRKEQGEWLKVEFHDQQFGLRTGYIQATYVLIQVERDISTAQSVDLGLKQPADAVPAIGSPETGATRAISPKAAPSASTANSRGTSAATTDTSSPAEPATAMAPPTKRASEAIAGADNPEKTVYVGAHTRQDGTKVKAHMRRPPGAGSDRENKKKKGSN